MLRTVMIAVMGVGVLAMLIIWAVGISKAHSPKNTYLQRPGARWPTSRHGGYSDEAAARYAEETARPRRIAYVCAGVAVSAGLLAAYVAASFGASRGLQIVAVMAVTYVVMWAAFLIGRRLIHR